MSHKKFSFYSFVLMLCKADEVITQLTRTAKKGNSRASCITLET